MKPLRVGLIVKNKPGSFERDGRQCGYFSYTVPEFAWTHLTPGKQFRLDMAAMRAQGFDLIFHEDGGNWGEYAGKDLPVVYYSVDSTLSEDHYAARAAQAARADLILVDHDRLSRFKHIGVPVRRWSYCVNDRLFFPGEKTVDIAYHCNSGGEENSRRAQVRNMLREYCPTQDWTLSSDHLTVPAYAAALRRARVVVNLPRMANNRPHRVYDAMAAGAAFLTAPLPEVSGEDRRAGVHYVEFDSNTDLRDELHALLDGDGWETGAGWQEYADASTLWAQGQTWAVRAKELRELIYKELGL